jgi:thymidine phosphorylase
VVTTDGTQPVGRGVGPALEAHDALAVLQGKPEAPADLRERAVELAGRVLEHSGKVEVGKGDDVARETIADGRAWKKFVAICEAQGGLHEPPTAPYKKDVVATRPGVVNFIDNRRLARVAKLAGAPHDRAAGLEMHVRLGEPVEPGEPLFTIHAESRGELDYSHSYVEHEYEIVRVGE